MISIGLVKYSPVDTLNIRCDRASPLGNPYHITKGRDRDDVCDMYQAYFDEEVKKDTYLRREVIRLYKLAKAGNNLNLQCWCYPQRCHVETIKNFLDSHLEK